LNEAKALHSTQDPKNPQQSNNLLFKGFLSKLAKLISNLTYLQKKHVERSFLEGTKQHNIGLILSHTRMDDKNPTLREWCLMIIRNMCQVSEGIRKVLEDLKKVEVKDDTMK